MRRTSLLWWLFGIVIFLALEMSFYPTLRNQSAQLESALANLPSGVKSLIGGGDYSSPVGYLNGRVFYLILPMLQSILGISLGGSLLAKEERDGTLEQLLARPVSRSRILAAKGFAVVAVLFVTSLVAVVALLPMIRLTHMDIAMGGVWVSTLLCLLFVLSLAAIAFMLTAIGRFARGASVGIASAIGLGGYIVSSLSVQVSWLKWPSRLFPFHYYQPEQALRGEFPVGAVLFPIVIVAICGFVSWFAFRRRDITS